jgi:hypothetical protein
MRLLIGCEFSAVVREAFRARGHDAWSCDLLPSERPGPHIQANVLSILGDGWDMGIFFPPCTYLTRSGWHWVNKPDSYELPLKGEPRRQAAYAARDFFLELLDAPIPKIAIENPRPISHVRLPKPQQVIQPWEFGEPEMKATCLWLKNLPPLMATVICAERNTSIHREPPGPERSKNRSRTFRGIAEAMAEQWG